MRLRQRPQRAWGVKVGSPSVRIGQLHNLHFILKFRRHAWMTKLVQSMWRNSTIIRASTPISAYFLRWMSSPNDEKIRTVSIKGSRATLECQRPGTKPFFGGFARRMTHAFCSVQATMDASNRFKVDPRICLMLKSSTFITGRNDELSASGSSGSWLSLAQ